MFKAELVDLSLGGAAIISEKAFARFVPIDLVMTLAGKSASLPAQVVHIRPTTADYREQREWLCGVRFGELTRDEGELVGRHLVESLR